MYLVFQILCVPQMHLLRGKYPSCKSPVRYMWKPWAAAHFVLENTPESAAVRHTSCGPLNRVGRCMRPCCFLPLAVWVIHLISGSTIPLSPPWAAIVGLGTKTARVVFHDGEMRRQIHIYVPKSRLQVCFLGSRHAFVS